MVLFFFSGYGHHRDLHVLTHSYPTRRSSDLGARRASPAAFCAASAILLMSPARQASMRPRAEASRAPPARRQRSEEHTSELKSLMRISYAVFCLKKKMTINTDNKHTTQLASTKSTHKERHRTLKNSIK